jgi:hypothetical protein
MINDAGKHRVKGEALVETRQRHSRGAAPSSPLVMAFAAKVKFRINQWAA